MPELEDIRQGLAANLTAVKSDLDCQVSAYLLENPTPPCLMVLGPDEAEATTFGGTDEAYEIIIQGLAGAISDIGGQRRLDRWWKNTGTGSVAAAIRSDPTLTQRLELDGTVITGQPAVADSVILVRKGAYQIYDLPNHGRVVGCEWVVQVDTSD